RDHRKLGAELDLFSFPDEIGSGLAVFHPKGGAIRRIMEDYSRRRHEAAGYEFVNSPHITKAALLEESGHLDRFADGMFPPMALATDAEWNEATAALRTVGEAAGLELVMDEGGGAFYGPKISVQARDAIGRTWQMSTVQLDLQLPQRFGLEYVGADNERHQPV